MSGSYHCPDQFEGILFRDEILTNEAKDTKAKIVHLLKEETLANLNQAGQFIGFNSFKSVAGFHDETTSLLSKIEAVNQAVSEEQSLTVGKARSLRNLSAELLSETDDLSFRIGLEILFNG